MKVCEVQVSYKPKHANNPKISRAKDAFALKELAFNMDTINYQEQFAILLLNRANRVIGYSTISVGGQFATYVDVKMIAQRAILTHACGVILMHNHPSGALFPSSQDDELTSKIEKALNLFDIKTLDHIIVTDDENEYYSYKDYGKL